MCGRVDVDNLLAEMSSEQLAEWMAFEAVEGPIGQRRMDYQFAALSATLANVMRAKGPAKDIEDFLLWKEKRVLSDDELMSKMNAMFGGM